MMKNGFSYAYNWSGFADTTNATSRNSSNAS